MRDLWKAFVARVVYWMTPKPPLTSEICQCEHWRCGHVKGEGYCVFEYPPEELGRRTMCGCQVFIPKKDDGDHSDSEAPSPSELERLYQK